jgi:hypothetical protein
MTLREFFALFYFFFELVMIFRDPQKITLVGN